MEKTEAKKRKEQIANEINEAGEFADGLHNERSKGGFDALKDDI